MTQYRVSCAEYTSEPFGTEVEAWQQLTSIDKVCTELHTIHVQQEGGEWLPLHQHKARQILAAKVGSTIEGLVKCHGGWSAETAERAGAVAEPGSPEWYAALGPHETATLTADGRGAETSAWCMTHTHPADIWVRYERWSARGQEAHGYVCPESTCRHLVQSG